MKSERLVMHDIKTLIWVIAICIVFQTVWFVGEKVLAPAVGYAAGAITDVNIVQVGGDMVKGPYARPIKVEVVK